MLNLTIMKTRRSVCGETGLTVTATEVHGPMGKISRPSGKRQESGPSRSIPGGIPDVLLRSIWSKDSDHIREPGLEAGSENGQYRRTGGHSGTEARDQNYYTGSRLTNWKAILSLSDTEPYSDTSSNRDMG
jgi:hypothetical protein